MIESRRVPSASEPAVTYHVDIDEAGRAVCNCLGFDRHSHCKHIEEAERAMNEENGNESRSLVPLELSPVPVGVPRAGELQEMLEFAKVIIQAKGLIPTAIDTPGKALAVIASGRELGVGPMTAFRHIYVVNGRAEPDGQLMMGLVKARDPSAEFIFHKRSAQECDVELRRGGKPAARLRYTPSDAPASRKAGPWTEYKEDMLAWFTIKRVCRFGAADIVNSIGPLDVSEVIDVEATEIPAPSAADNYQEPELVTAPKGGGSLAEKPLYEEAAALAHDMRASHDAEAMAGSLLDRPITSFIDMVNRAMREKGYRTMGEALTALGYTRQSECKDPQADWERLPSKLDGERDSAIDGA